jgi:hypothetical protein
MPSSSLDHPHLCHILAPGQLDVGFDSDDGRIVGVEAPCMERTRVENNNAVVVVIVKEVVRYLLVDLNLDLVLVNREETFQFEGSDSGSGTRSRRPLECSPTYSHIGNCQDTPGWC